MRWLAVVGLLLAPRLSLANGRPAATTSVAFAANSQRIIAGATFGALVSDDGGTTWQLVCEDPLGTAGVVADPVFRDSTPGLLLVGSSQGLLYSRDGGCSYTHGGGAIANQSVADLAVSPTDPMHVLAATNTNGADNGIQVSNDGGVTWSAPGAVANTTFQSVAFAPDGQRVYALAVQVTTTSTQVFRSDDGGNHFSPVGSPAAGLVAPRILGVSPTDANTFYFTVVGANNSAFYQSTDGGATLQAVADGIPAIYGGLVAADGSVYLATSSGVRRLGPGSMMLGAPPSGSPPVTCLALHGGALFGCSTEEASGFALARSTDDGQTWTPILRFSRDITGPLGCASATDVCVQCYPKWSTFAAQFNIANAMAPMCGAVGGDAGAPMPDGGGHAASGAGSGCGCSVGAEAVFPGGLVLLVIALVARRMRRNQV